MQGITATDIVSTLTVANGTVTVAFNAAVGGSVADGHAIAFVPTDTAGGSITWECNGAGTTLESQVSPGQLPLICKPEHAPARGHVSHGRSE